MPVLQDAVLANGEGLKNRTVALDIQYKSGIITKNQFLSALELDTIPDGDVYYVEPKKETPPTSEPQPQPNESPIND